MPISLKSFLTLLITAGIIGGFCIPELKTQEPTPPENTLSGLLIIEENSLLANSPLPPPKVVKKIRVVATAYSSTIQETDADPFTTAAGTQVRDGIIANNLLPFGTKIRLPELYGDKVFVVEDRMNWKKGYYHIDIWFPSYWEAKDFGAKNTYIEILES